MGRERAQEDEVVGGLADLGAALGHQQLAEELLPLGFTALKVKIGRGDLAADLETIRAVRRLIAIVRMAAVMRYSIRARAIP